MVCSVLDAMLIYQHMFDVVVRARCFAWLLHELELLKHVYAERKPFKRLVLPRPCRRCV